MTRTFATVVFVLAAGLGACAGQPSKAAGQTCNASSECGPDLLCDFAQTPAVCAASGPAPADASFDASRFRPDAAATPDAKPSTVDAPSAADATVDADVDAMPDA